MADNKWHSILTRNSVEKFLSSLRPGDIVQIVWSKERDQLRDPWSHFCKSETIVWPRGNIVRWSSDKKYRWQCDVDVYRVQPKNVVYCAQTRMHCGKGDKLLMELQSMKARIL